MHASDIVLGATGGLAAAYLGWSRGMAQLLALALVAAGIAIGHVLRHFVRPPNGGSEG